MICYVYGHVCVVLLFALRGADLYCDFHAYRRYDCFYPKKCVGIHNLVTYIFVLLMHAVLLSAFGRVASISLSVPIAKCKFRIPVQSRTG